VNTRSAALLALAIAAARPLSAQGFRDLGVEGVVGRVRFSSTMPSGGEALSGVVVGGGGRLTLGRVSLEAYYAQGRLSPDTGSAASRDLVEGGAFLVVKPTDWLSLKAGPHLRAFVAPGGTERWVMWEGRAFAEAPILADILRARVGGWIAVASGVNADPGAGGARGGEVGLTLRPPRSALLVRLAYTIDREAMRGDARTETLESVILTVGFGGR
jgi:hypothetical protein